MGVIHVLDARVADQIAAGEVVERPASVVKELVENALDAGARRVEVEIAGGGLERITVVDDGRGMDAADAVLCFSRHATSKLAAADDLLRIGTFGFRGEALAAISSVSRVHLRTRRAEDASAYEVKLDAGRVMHVGETGAPAGTRIDVEGLFFNTPARKKFLKAERTEAGHVEDAVASAALSLPDVAFRVLLEGKLALDLPAAPGALADPLRIDRAVRCLGKHVRPLLFPFEASTELLTLSGYVVAPLETRRDLAGVHLSVNTRPVSDRGLVQAVRTAFRTLLEVGRQPIVALDVRIDPTAVDINVHPRKSEVRFAEPRRVTGHVIALLSDFLAGTPWLKTRTDAIRPRVMVLASTTDPSPSASTPGASSSHAMPALWGTSGGAPSSAAPGPGASGSSSSSSPGAWPSSGPASLPEGGAVATASAPGDLNDAHRNRIRDAMARFDAARGAGLPFRRAFEAIAPPSLVAVAGVGSAASFSALRVVGQIAGTYLVLEAPDGMVVIDQHAAHERVVFERLRARKSDGAPSQPLLIPITVELNTTELSALDDEGRALLDKHGLVVEPFGPRTAIVKAVPPGLDGKRAEQITRDALAELASSSPGSALDDRVDRVCARLACHAAIRAGDAMAPESIRALLRDLDAIDLGAHCPHGRPVVRTVRTGELAQWFDRR